MSEDCHLLAFKYTVKAADQAIYRGAFSDGLNYVQSAAKLEMDANNVKVLIRVINRAIQDLEPKGFFSGFGKKKAQTASDTVLANAVASELEGFKDVKTKLENVLKELDPNGAKYSDIESNHPSRKASLANSEVENSKSPMKGQNLLDAWEPSYTAGKTVKANNKNGNCVIC